MSKKNKTNKNKSKKSKSKNGQSNRTRMVRSQPRQSIAPLIRSVCAITDPFCMSAWGSKFPDSRSARTLGFPYRARVSLGTDGSGRGAALFCPGFTFNYASPAVLPSNDIADFTVFSAGTFVPGFAAAIITGYRINSMGFRIKNTATPLDSKGILRIRGLGARTGATFTTINASNYQYDFNEDIPIQDVKDVCVIFRKLDETAEYFNLPATTNPTGNVADWISPGWGAVSLVIAGAAASITLDLELYVNYEIVFADDSSNALLMTKAKPSNSLITQASAAITNSMNPVIANGVNRVEKYIAANAYNYLAKAVGTVAGGYFGGPRGAMVGYSAANSLIEGPMEVD